MILGAVLSLASLALFKETSGWYIILVALLFAVEIFARPLAWLEVAVEALLSIALYLILDDFNVTQIGHFLFGASFIWLGGDLIFGYFVQEKRIHEPITLAVGYLLVLSSTLILWDAGKPGLLTIYLAVYAIFFALAAFLKKEPRLGYLATAYLALVIIKFCDVIEL